MHPIKYVNRSQSTNNVCLTAMRVAVCCFAIEHLLSTMAELRQPCKAKVEEFSNSTGINTDPRYAPAAVQYLWELTHLPLTQSLS